VFEDVLCNYSNIYKLDFMQVVQKAVLICCIKFSNHLFLANILVKIC